MLTRHADADSPIERFDWLCPRFGAVFWLPIGYVRIGVISDVKMVAFQGLHLYL